MFHCWDQTRITWHRETSSVPARQVFGSTNIYFSGINCIVSFNFFSGVHTQPYPLMLKWYWFLALPTNCHPGGDSVAMCRSPTFTSSAFHTVSLGHTENKAHRWVAGSSVRKKDDSSSTVNDDRTLFSFLFSTKLIVTDYYCY